MNNAVIYLKLIIFVVSHATNASARTYFYLSMLASTSLVTS